MLSGMTGRAARIGPGPASWPFRFFGTDGRARRKIHSDFGLDVPAEVEGRATEAEVRRPPAHRSWRAPQAGARQTPRPGEADATRLASGANGISPSAR